MIPTAEKCFEAMDTYAMLDNIKEHSIVVERIAVLIARGLLETGINLSLEIVSAGALMHDIAKTQSLDTTVDHTVLGKAICLEQRMDEIADIVGEHVTLKDFDSTGPITEKEIVYYADKRVNHSSVVSLDERLEYLLHRYGNGNKRIIKAMLDNFIVWKEVEKRLFARLHFGPEDLAAKVKEEASPLDRS